MSDHKRIKEWQRAFWRILIRKTGVIAKIDACDGKDKEDSLVDFCCLGGMSVVRKYDDVLRSINDDERDM